MNTRTLELAWSGLLPFGDPRDGELVRAQLVGNDAWSIAGLEVVATMARLAGDEDVAPRAAAEAREFRAIFSAALVRAKQPDVPPSWQGVGRDCGNTSVGYRTRDSAMAVEPRPEDDVDTRHTRGQLYELVGLPVDALAIYLDLLHRVPGDAATLSRRALVPNRLRDPITTDEEWARRGAARGARAP